MSLQTTYDHNNIFAKIIAGDIPCDKVYESEHVLAFRDISPAAPVHILVIPKQAYISFDDFSLNASQPEMIAFFQTVQQIAQEEGVQQSGYRIIMNHGADASQTVPHFHAHILAGKQLGGLLTDDKHIR